MNKPALNCCKKFFLVLLKAMQIFCSSLSIIWVKLLLPEDPLNPFASLWRGREQFGNWLAFQQSFYQQQMNLWLNFLGNAPQVTVDRQQRTSDFHLPNGMVIHFIPIKQNYLLTSKWLTEMVDGAMVDDEQKKKWHFYQAIYWCHESGQLCCYQSWCYKTGYWDQRWKSGRRYAPHAWRYAKGISAWLMSPFLKSGKMWL